MSSVAYNETIVTHCKDGYEQMSGDLERTCLLNKTFTGNELVCSGMYLFLAHLAQSAKVSFWDDPLSVVRRRRRPSCVVNNLLKHLLL